MGWSAFDQKTNHFNKTIIWSFWHTLNTRDQPFNQQEQSKTQDRQVETQNKASKDAHRNISKPTDVSENMLVGPSQVEIFNRFHEGLWITGQPVIRARPCDVMASTWINSDTFKPTGRDGGVTVASVTNTTPQEVAPTLIKTHHYAADTYDTLILQSQIHWRAVP